MGSGLDSDCGDSIGSFGLSPSLSAVVLHPAESRIAGGIPDLRTRTGVEKGEARRVMFKQDCAAPGRSCRHSGVPRAAPVMLLRLDRRPFFIAEIESRHPARKPERASGDRRTGFDGNSDWLLSHPRIEARPCGSTSSNSTGLTTGHNHRKNEKTVLCRLGHDALQKLMMVYCSPYHHQQQFQQDSLDR